MEQKQAMSMFESPGSCHFQLQDLWSPKGILKIIAVTPKHWKMQHDHAQKKFQFQNNQYLFGFFLVIFKTSFQFKPKNLYFKVYYQY